MPTIFSHPAYPTSDGYSTVGYNLIVSRAKGNTYSSASVATGSHVITPASMVNINVGSILDVDPGTSVYEAVTVTATTSTTFTATFVNVHGSNFVIQSRALAPNYFGPWISLQSNYTSNLSIVDMSGCRMDLYRVQPIVQLNAGQPSAGPQIALDYSRAFFFNTPLFDAQISSLIDHFRTNFIADPGIRGTDSTVTTESTGQGMLPFITDANTSRFYLAFLSNTDPVKVRESDLLIYQGISEAVATPLIPYQDFYANIEGGYIDFAVNPPASDYLRVEYTNVQYTDYECRSALLNAVSEVPLYGITDQTYQVNNSNNYFYLNQSLPNRDLAQIVCAIAQKNLLGSTIYSSFKSAESWKLGPTEYTADPSRSIQAGTLWHQSLKKQIEELSYNYIINTRTYFSRGEFDSFFDNAGILYPPFSVYNVFNYMSWWL